MKVLSYYVKSVSESHMEEFLCGRLDGKQVETPILCSDRPLSAHTHTHTHTHIQLLSSGDVINN